MTTYGIYSTWCEGTVTQGEKTMIVNGLSECPSTTAFSFGPGSAVQLAWVNVDSKTIFVSGDAIFTVSAERVGLLYRSMDLTAAGASATSGSGNSGSGSGSDSGVSSGSGSGSSLPASRSGHGKDLSTGATAGIAIGAAAVGIAAVLALFYLYIRHREARNKRYGKQVDFVPAHTSEGSYPPPSSAGGATTHVLTGAEHELNATNSVSSRPTHAAIGISPVIELQGSMPVESPHPGAWPQSGVGDFYQNMPHGGAVVSGMEEVSATNGYHQLPVTLEREKGMLGHSRQATPTDLIGRVVEARWSC